MISRADGTRLKVRCKDGQVAAVEKMWTRTHCSVQLKGHTYYTVVVLDDLEPITEDEYRRAK